MGPRTRSTTLLRTIVPRTLSALERELARRAPDDVTYAWLFEPAPARRAAESRLADRGIKAVFRSAYKPLLHAFLEELDLEGVTSIDVGYPVVVGVPTARFLLECYPLDALVGDRSLSFHAVNANETVPGGLSGPPPLRYAVTLCMSDGTQTMVQVPAPNRRVTTTAGESALANCGWYTGPLVTDLEQAFDLAIECIGRHPWPLDSGGPFFDRLSITLSGPFSDAPLPVGSECVSLAEAMHEDLYFSALEMFSRLPRSPGNTCKPGPGQIVPLLKSVRDGDWHLSVELEPARLDSVPGFSEAAGVLNLAAVPCNSVVQELSLVRHWLMPRDIAAHLDALGGDTFTRLTHQGRSVHARHVQTTCRNTCGAVFISAGQHANETSGMIGVLRAAHDIKATGQLDFVVAPLMNPDGYALFRECCHDHPRHLHHAARYTALGHDLADGDDAFEHGIWVEARARTTASLHINCHGYPGHEWTRPFTGYIPRGFARWTMPRGFFLIMRYAPGYRDTANRIVDACVVALNAFGPLMAINAEQLARHSRYISQSGIDLRSGVPVVFTEVGDGLFPMTLITEAPDETVYGERFRVLHEAQRRVVLAAVMANQ